MQQLEAMAGNNLDYPNIPTKRFQSVKRSLQLYMLKTYGIRIAADQIPLLGSGNNMTVDFMVLAVNGSLNPTSSNLKRDIIYIANQVFNPQDGYTKKASSTITFVLNTPSNPNITVTIKQALGNGAIAVNEALTEDILQINSAKVGGSFPYLRYTGPFRI